MDTKIRLKLAQRIKESRRKIGLTQEKLSETSGIDYKYIQRIEGKNPPNIKLETIERLAKTLKTTPSKLLDF
ncbi:MAG: helix-turn-helix transcriptional regulator [Candidatus Omnitrophota bacterium]|jgi:transcriptional regulator with XRE-family HTH domain